MNKFLAVSMTAAAIAFAAPASAADLPVKAHVPPPPVYTWTGCYVGVGVGYGLYNIAHYGYDRTTGAISSASSNSAGTGSILTGQFGCDYQMTERWLIGVFIDGDWSNIRGDLQARLVGTGGSVLPDVRQRSAWSVGARVGYLVTPSLLTYVNGGFAGSRFDASAVNFATAPFTTTGLVAPSTTYRGWFIGGGAEYAMGFLPGLFWKTEYRFADYGNRDLAFPCVNAGPGVCVAGTTFAIGERWHPYVQTIRSSLVYRFGGGAVAAKY